MINIILTFLGYVLGFGTIGFFFAFVIGLYNETKKDIKNKKPIFS